MERAPKSHARVMVHRHAPAVIRRHLVRGTLRFLALVLVDLSMYNVVRAGLRAIRDVGLLGHAVAGFTGELFPERFLGGWEYALALFVGLVVAGTYRRGHPRRDAGSLLIGVALATALVLWAHAWEIGFGPVAVQFTAAVVAVWTALALGRLAADWARDRFLPAWQQPDRVVFVGHPDEPLHVRAVEKLVRGERMENVGWVCERAPGNGTRWLGPTGEFWRILQEAVPDTVVLCGSLENGTFESVVEAATAAGSRVLAVSQRGTGGRVRPRLVWESGLPFMELSVPSLKGQQLAVKRVIDVFGAAIGLLVSAPLLALIAVMIKLDSRGPIFFSQERVGLGGKVFRMLKFRTMRHGADREKQDMAHLNHTGDPRLFKIRNDPRITRFGAWLRRWSLDELPQLLNVLRGDMSLIGPRPFFEADLAGYSEHHFARLGARPGITGLWQVKGRSDVVDFEEVVRLDREYIDQWSLLLDLRIILLTIPAVLQKTGAY